MTVAPTLETDRLRLRAFTAADLEPISAMMADAAVMRHLGASALSREEAWRRMLCAPGLWAVLGYGYWAVERRADGLLVGQVGLADFKRDMTPDIEGLPEAGWVFSAAAHGQGYATEAVRAVLAWADEVLNAPQITAIIAPANTASMRVADKVGFSEREIATYKNEPIYLYRRRR